MLFRNFKIVQLDRRFDAPETRENSYEQNSQPQANFDYRKFLDFGFFSNAGATFAGAPHPSTQNGQVFSYEKQISPNTVILHKTVFPKSEPAEVFEFINLHDGRNLETFIAS